MVCVKCCEQLGKMLQLWLNIYIRNWERFRFFWVREKSVLVGLKQKTGSVYCLIRFTFYDGTHSQPNQPLSRCFFFLLFIAACDDGSGTPSVLQLYFPTSAKLWPEVRGCFMFWFFVGYLDANWGRLPSFARLCLVHLIVRREFLALLWLLLPPYAFFHIRINLKRGPIYLFSLPPQILSTICFVSRSADLAQKRYHELDEKAKQALAIYAPRSTGKEMRWKFYSQHSTSCST